MKGFTHFLRLGLLLVALGVVCPRVGAQGIGLSVTASDNPILVSNSLTYTINITNLTGFNFPVALVTNILPPTAQLQNVTQSQGTNSVSTNVVLFNLGNFLFNGIVQLTITAQPTTVGLITNTVVFVAVGITNTAPISVVVQVTNLAIQTDLGVTITGPSQAVITNDLMTYSVTATNLGPNTIPNVVLTNTFPAGVTVVSPANLPGNSIVIFGLGTLTNGAFTNLLFTVEPTNAGVLPFSASIGAPSLVDTNTANNFATTNILVTNYLSGPLGITTNSAQTYNPQNGLMEQFITVTNNTAGTIDSTRVIVSGLTNLLVNCVGTNTGNPFVYYIAPLAAGQTASLLLQYYTPTRSPFSFSNSQLNAFAVPSVSFPAPGPAGVSAALNISRIVQLANGNMLLEWPTTVNRTYTVVYSDNAGFSNAMMAPPSIIAPANRLQWIDYGPPTTISLPTNAARFYRVYQNP